MGESTASGTATADDIPGATQAERAQSVEAPWRQHWELWLALALAAFLRLWHIELTQFLQDQVDLTTPARQAILRGALPVTSNLSSIGAYHPPLPVYFLVPFLTFTSDPLPAAISIALLNVAAVGLCYVFTLRYFGRVAAATAALLFATSDTLINYSRFLWQPNYVAPLLALLALALYRGCVRGKGGWLVPSVALLTMSILCHETSVLLIPLLIVALLIAPLPPSRREWLLAAAVTFLLLLPTLLFEVVSRGYDLRVYLHSLGKGGSINAQVFSALKGLLDGPGIFGFSGAPYDGARGVYPLLNLAAVLLFVAGYCVLSVRFALPMWGRWQGQSQSAAPTSAKARLLEWWRAIRQDAGWRTSVLLWIWVTVPILGMIRHSVPVTVHYLLILVPAVFIVQGIGAAWLFQWLRALVVRQMPSLSFGQLARGIAFVVVALLVLGQGVRWALYPATLAAGKFAAYQGYGYPLTELQQLDTQLAVLQRDARAGAVYLVTPDDPRYAEAFDDTLVSEHADRSSFGAECLVLPAPGAGPALIVATQPDTPAGDLVARLPGASLVSAIALAGGDPLPVYSVPGGVAALPDEHMLPPVTFSGADGASLRLEAAAQPSLGVVRLRWTVLSPPATATGRQPQIRVALQAGDTAALNGKTDCHPTQLSAGQTLFTWTRLASPNQQGVPASAATTVAAYANTIGLDTPALGPLPLITGRPSDSPLVPLNFAPGANGGAYPLPSGALLPAG